MVLAAEQIAPKMIQARESNHTPVKWQTNQDCQSMDGTFLPNPQYGSRPEQEQNETSSAEGCFKSFKPFSAGDTFI